MFDTATNTLITTIPVGSDPRGLAITPDGASLWVTNSVADSVSVIDTATNTVTNTLTSTLTAGGNAPYWAAFAVTTPSADLTVAVTDSADPAALARVSGLA